MTREIVRKKSEVVKRKKSPPFPLSPSPPLPLSHSPTPPLSPSPTLSYPKAGSAKSQLAELFNDMEIIGCNQEIDA